MNYDLPTAADFTHDRIASLERKVELMNLRVIALEAAVARAVRDAR